jgi:ankyrin repeat protein
LLMAIRSEFMMPLVLDDPNLADSLGRKPWKRTVVEDGAHARTSAAVVRMLLEHGANVHALDRQGHDAIFYASGDCQSEVVKLLKSAGAAGHCRASPVLPGRWDLSLNTET